MLKPIKTFLTYLQRNANSSNIFGLTTTMGPTEQPRLEESIMIANEDLANESGDPLYDPLALDDDCPGGVAVEGIDVHAVSVGSEVQLLSDEGEGEVVDGVTSGKIILVDVTSLKSSMDQPNELETDDEDGDDEMVKVISDTEEMPGKSSAEVLILNSSSEAADGPEDTSQTSVVNDRSSEGVMEVESDGLLDSSSATENDSFKALPFTPVTIVVEDRANEPEKVLANGHTADDTSDAPIAVSACVNQLPEKQQKNGEENAAIETTTPAENIQGSLAGGKAAAEEEEASDGSDSGLGLEPATRNVVATSNGSSSSSTPLILPPIKSSLKRRSEPCNVPSEFDEGVSKEKRPKKAITFEGVTVYYFPRIQGFGCVPTQGGCTLGMEYQHIHSRRLTLAEHSSEQRKVHRQQLQELNPRSSSSDDTSSEEEPSESGSEAESESYGFLQPVTTRQRRALLKAAGVRKIDSTEKDECREIRTSREVCGCTCRSFCDPATCACSLAGIKCQVDRPNFPCGCTLEGCANVVGRVEFNQSRVRSHYEHTMRRLNMDGMTNEMRRPVAVNGPGVAAGPGSSVTDCGTLGDSSYAAGSEKNWSNGPIRLQQHQSQHEQRMMYVGGMHGAVPSPGSSGVGTEGPMDYHHHSLPPSAYHQPLPLQAPPQYFGPPPDDSYMAGPAYHDYMARNAQMLLTAPSATSNPQHHIDGLISPAAHTTGPVDVHYAYRDYFVGGTSSGATPTVSSEQQLLSHGQMYYVYGGGSSSAVVGDPSADPNYSHSHLPVTTPPLQPAPPPPPPIHQHGGSGGISPYHPQPVQHMLPTGHDRHQTTGYDNGPTITTANAAVHMSNVTTTATLDTPDGASFVSSGSLFPSNRIFTSENNPTSIVTLGDSANSITLLDSNVEEPAKDEGTARTTAAVVPNGSQSPVISVDDNDDNNGDGGGGDDRRSSEKSGESSQPDPSSCFIDLSAPVAGNPERLEAINDMLASSRRSANLARRSIAAEDDDELRDFRHSPLPPAVTIDSDGDDDNDEVIVDDSTNVSTSGGKSTTAVPLVVVNGGEGHQNGTEPLVKRVNALVENSKRVRQDALRSSPTNATDESTQLLANKQAKTDSTTGTAGPSADTSGSVSPEPGEPSENLCEIIKNSIVETAVSH